MSTRNNFYDSSFLMGNPQDGSPSSVYALKIALITMKDRCQKLQNRLSAMEEENLQLRIERHSIPGIYKKEPENNPEVSVLNRKVEELLRQKSKLSHHIYMVATENKDLWEKLYKLSDEKFCTENNLNVQTETKHKYSNFKPLRSLHIAEICKDGKEESLEEISLKGISATTESKNALESQSSSVQTKPDGLKVKGCEFTLSDMSEEEEMECEDVTLNELNEILEKLKTEKGILQKQQTDLQTTLNIMSDFYKENIPCKACTARMDEEISRNGSEKIDEGDSDEKNKSEGEIMNIDNGIVSLKNKENNFEDRICPLCTKFYAKSTPFDEFNDHVLSHFVEEPERDDQHMSIYEVIA